MDAAGDGAVGDAGDEVADVLVAAEVGHGVVIGQRGTVFCFGGVEAEGAGFEEGAVAGVAAALDGGAAVGGEGGFRIGR
jgi:hypothetical protein